MGVYIKGIEMPQSCESCPCKTADAFGGLGCQATGYIPLRKANQDRPDNCPLVPVPPHGRLIDEIIVLEMIRKSLGIKDLSFLYHAEKSVVNEIFHAPTVIEAGRERT